MDSEIPEDILPEAPVATPQEETVSEDVNPVSEEPGTETPEAPESQAPEGYVPYSRFKEVNQKAKELEKQLQDLQETPTPEEEFVESDPDRVSTLEKELQEVKLGRYLDKYPELSEKSEELQAFLGENSSLPLERAILLFRAEQGMIAAPSRKGLETVVQGPKTAPEPKWTLEKIDEMRESNPKEWEKQMMSGTFDETLKGKW